LEEKQQKKGPAAKSHQMSHMKKEKAREQERTRGQRFRKLPIFEAPNKEGKMHRARVRVAKWGEEKQNSILSLGNPDGDTSSANHRLENSLAGRKNKHRRLLGAREETWPGSEDRKTRQPNIPSAM